MKRTAIALLLFASMCLSAGCLTVFNRVNSNSLEDLPLVPIDLNEQESEEEQPPGQVNTRPNEPEQEQTTPPPETPRPETLEEQMERTIQATITMEDGGVIVIELSPDVAPQSVRNFVYLARDGFYDGLKFHRIIRNFMIQGGCPLGTGTGNPGYSIHGEFADNGFDNELEHTAGVLSMARSGDPNSAGSQFFIVHRDSPHLNGLYAAFGKVTSGMDVVDSLAQIPVTDNNGSVAEANKPVIKSITIDDDVELPEPDRLSR